MTLIGIVAVSRDLAIGKDGKLPWHYSADLKFFKETTTGHAVLMGSNTWRSIGRPLPGRVNIVLSRSRNVQVPEGVLLLDSKPAALEAARNAATDLYVIGGAQVFRDFADDIDRWLVTEVPLTIDDADVYMPRDFLNGFELESTRELGEGLVVKSYHRTHGTDIR